MNNPVSIAFLISDILFIVSIIRNACYNHKLKYIAERTEAFCKRNGG